MGRNIRPDLKSDVRRQIVEAMNKRNVTPSELSRMLGVTPQTVSRFLREGHNLTIDTVERISRALNQRFEFRMEDRL